MLLAKAETHKGLCQNNIFTPLEQHYLLKGIVVLLIGSTADFSQKGVNGSSMQYDVGRCRAGEGHMKHCFNLRKHMAGGQQRVLSLAFSLVGIQMLICVWHQEVMIQVPCPVSICNGQAER